MAARLPERQLPRSACASASATARRSSRPARVGRRAPARRAIDDLPDTLPITTGAARAEGTRPSRAGFRRLPDAATSPSAAPFTGTSISLSMPRRPRPQQRAAPPRHRSASAPPRHLGARLVGSSHSHRPGYLVGVHGIDPKIARSRTPPSTCQAPATCSTLAPSADPMNAGARSVPRTPSAGALITVRDDGDRARGSSDHRSAVEPDVADPSPAATRSSDREGLAPARRAHARAVRALSFPRSPASTSLARAAGRLELQQITLLVVTGRTAPRRSERRVTQLARGRLDGSSAQ